MLRFVNILQAEQPATVLAMDGVFWDSKGCTATITMGCTTPGRLARACGGAGGVRFLACRRVSQSAGRGGGWSLLGV